MSYPRYFEEYTPDLKGIMGELDELGVLRFAVQAGEGSSIRGTELFNRMLAYFGGQVRAIECLWLKNQAGDPSANIDRVNELTGEGVALDEAIKQTWTVTRAAKQGFVRPRILGIPEGTQGKYTRLEVRIER